MNEEDLADIEVEKTNGDCGNPWSLASVLGFSLCCNYICESTILNNMISVGIILPSSYQKAVSPQAQAICSCGAVT